VSLHSNWLRAGRSGVRPLAGVNFPKLCRPALRPTQPQVQWVPAPALGVMMVGRDADHPLISSPGVEYG
jgi:hypothetical protein